MRRTALSSLAGICLVAGLAIWTPAGGGPSAFGAEDDAGAGAKKAVRKKGVKGGGTAGLFAKLDANSDGKLGKDEFAKLPEVYSKGNAKAKGRLKAGGVEKLFTKLDADSDGFVSKDEFGKLGQGQARKRKKGNG